MNLLMQYIIASTDLYGIVPREKVLEIYLKQNDVTLDPDDFEDYVNKNEDILMTCYVYLHRHYFVHEAIMQFGDFELEMARRYPQPYFVPDK